MRIIDDKGRLFGKVNLLDFLVIALVLILIATTLINFVATPRGNKTNIDLLVKIIYSVPNEVARNPKILQSGDRILAGNAVVEKVLNIRPLKDGRDIETGYSDIIVLIRASCVKLNNEYYCANMPIKVNSPMAISNPFYIFSSGTILDVEIVKK